MMEFSGEFTSSHERDVLWNYFTDPDALAKAAPGCSGMELVEPYRIETELSVGVGSVKPTFDVEVTILECDAPARLKMQAGGDAARNAFEATASMDLEETDDDGTHCVWSTEADVSGLIASLGQRALGSVANRLVNKFFTDLEALVESDHDPNPRIEAAPASVGESPN